MSLAHRLNQLAAAHEQNLISDDDYRALRRDLFERLGSDSRSQHPPASAASRHQQPQPPSSAPTPPLPRPLSRKRSVVLNVANLLRRATGRPPRKLDPPPQPHPSQKRIPRTPAPAHPDPQAAQDQDDPHALRAAIVSAEAEYSRLHDAFVALEASTVKRIEYKTARRLYTPTPTNVDVLIEGREWRHHTRPVPSIVLPPPSITHHNHRHPPRTASGDQHSVHSTTSSSGLSATRSFSSSNPRGSHPPPPSSPLSSHFRSPGSLRRQASVSSASTHSTGTSSRFAAALGPRSTGNLYLSSLAERVSADTVADSRIITSDDVDADNDDPEAADYESAVEELNAIRRRGEELESRHHSRLEYLKARLKAAELRERVLRR